MHLTSSKRGSAVTLAIAGEAAIRYVAIALPPGEDTVPAASVIQVLDLDDMPEVKAAIREWSAALRAKGTTLRANAAERVIKVFSQIACRIVPECTEDTVSAEVAKRAGTSVGGAHAIMLRLPYEVPWIRFTPLMRSLRKAALYSMARVARKECEAKGNIDEIERWLRSRRFRHLLEVAQKQCKRSK